MSVVKKIVMGVCLVAAAILAFFQPEFLNKYKYIGYIIGDYTKLEGGVRFLVLFLLFSTVLLIWEGLYNSFLFARFRGWGVIGTIFALYFGVLLSLPIALYDLVFCYIFPTFRKFFIVLLLLVFVLVSIFAHGFLAYFMQTDVAELTGWKLVYAIYNFTGLLFFWVGVPWGWHKGMARGSIFGAIILAYIGLCLSLPIALVQLFTPEDFV